VNVLEQLLQMVPWPADLFMAPRPACWRKVMRVPVEGLVAASMRAQALSPARTGGRTCRSGPGLRQLIYSWVVTALTSV
jgi:hypothetical protein